MLQRFRTMVDELRANEQLVVEKFNVAKPSHDVAAIAKHNSVAPEQFALWSEANGLVLEWSEKAGDAIGRIELLSIENIFSDWKDTIWREGDDDVTRALRPIDFFQPEACAALVHRGAHPQVAFHYCGEHTDAMKVDVPGYLELLLKTRGFSYWQTAIVADLEGRDSTIEPQEFRDRMPELFPGFKLADVLRTDRSQQDAERASSMRSQRERLVAALEAAGAEFVVKNPKARSGYIEIEIADHSPANMKRVEAGLVAGHVPQWNGIAKATCSAWSIGNVGVSRGAKISPK